MRLSFHGKSVFDGRSAAIGSLAGAALVAAIGATVPDRPETGRFQIAAASEPNGETVGYVIDTATGAVWTETMGNVFILPKLDAANELLGSERTKAAAPQPPAKP